MLQMNGKNWAMVGFIEAFVFPAVALWLVAAGSSANSVFPFAAVGAIYPLGLVALVFFGVLFWFSGQDYPQSYIAFYRGARYAMIGIAAMSFPVLAFATFVLHQTAVASGFLLVGIGATWLPSAAAAGAYARSIGTGTSAESFVSQAKKLPYSSEKLVMVFLSLFLGELKALRKFYEPGAYLIVQAGLYIFGWIILNTLGAYPATIFGLAFVFIAPFTGYLLFRAGTSDQSRRALRNMLESYRR